MSDAEIVSEIVAAQKATRVRFTNTDALGRLSKRDGQLLLLIAQAIRAHRALEKNKKADEKIISLADMLISTLPIDSEESLQPDNIRRCLNNARCLLMNFAGNLKAEKYIRGMVKHHRVEDSSTANEKVEAILYFYEAYTFAQLMGMRQRIDRAVEGVLMSGYEYSIIDHVFNGIKTIVSHDESLLMSMGEEVALLPRYIP